MNAPVAESGISVADRLSAAGTANALELRGVSKLFGALAAISDVSITVRPGERRAVLGSNGAGKTTLFNCITGDFLPTNRIPRIRENSSRTSPHIPDLITVYRTQCYRQYLSGMSWCISGTILVPQATT